MTRFQAIGMLALFAASSPSQALDQGDTRFNGFGTLGITHLGGAGDNHGYGVSAQTTDHWRGEQLSRLGGQFQYGLTDTVGFTAQVIAKAHSDQWQLTPEWLYLTWHATDKFTMRAGKLDSPLYMYSETLNVGFANPWIRLPDEVYSQVPLNTYRGVDAIYTQPLPFGSLTLQVGGGQATNDKDYVLILDENVQGDQKKTGFINLTLNTNEYGSLRLGYKQTDLHASKSGVVTLPSGQQVNRQFFNFTGNTGSFTSLGYQYDDGVWVSSDEITRRYIEGNSDSRTTAFYTMAGRRFGNFLAHVTYGKLNANQGGERSWTYGLNYNISPTIVLKGEYKRVDASGGSNGVFAISPQQSADNALYNASGGTQGSPSRNFDGDVLSVGIDFVF